MSVCFPSIPAYVTGLVVGKCAYDACRNIKNTPRSLAGILGTSSFYMGYRAYDFFYTAAKASMQWDQTDKEKFKDLYYDTFRDTFALNTWASSSGSNIMISHTECFADRALSQYHFSLEEQLQFADNLLKGAAILAISAIFLGVMSCRRQAPRE